MDIFAIIKINVKNAVKLSAKNVRVKMEVAQNAF